MIIKQSQNSQIYNEDRLLLAYSSSSYLSEGIESNRYSDQLINYLLIEKPNIVDPLEQVEFMFEDWKNSSEMINFVNEALKYYESYREKKSLPKYSQEEIILEMIYFYRCSIMKRYTRYNFPTRPDFIFKNLAFSKYLDKVTQYYNVLKNLKNSHLDKGDDKADARTFDAFNEFKKIFPEANLEFLDFIQMMKNSRLDLDEILNFTRLPLLFPFLERGVYFFYALDENYPL
jgi:hypothetical protein